MHTKLKLSDVHVMVFKGARQQESQHHVEFNGKEIYCGDTRKKGHSIKVKDLQKCDEEDRVICFASGKVRFNIEIPQEGDKAKEARHFLACVVDAYDACRNGDLRNGGSASTAFSPINAMNKLRSPVPGGRHRVMVFSESRGSHRGPSHVRASGSSQSSVMSRSHDFSLHACSTGSADLAGLSKAPKMVWNGPSFVAPGTSPPGSFQKLKKNSYKRSFSSTVSDDHDPFKESREKSGSSESSKRRGVGKKDAVDEIESFVAPSSPKTSSPRNDISLLFRNSQLQNPSTPNAREAYPTSSTDVKKLSKSNCQIHESGDTSALKLPFPPSSSSASSPHPPGRKREGLINNGNTCYLNSVVQALAAAGDFVDDLLSTFWLRQTLQDLRRPSKRRHLKVYGSFSGLLLALRQKSDKAMKVSSAATGGSTGQESDSSAVTDPSLFRREMAINFTAYGDGRQQDAHEFLGDLLNTLQEELFMYGWRFARSKVSAEKEAARAAANCDSNMKKRTTEVGRQMVEKRVAQVLGTVSEPIIGGGKKGQTLLRNFLRPRTNAFSSRSEHWTSEWTKDVKRKQKEENYPENLQDDKRVTLSSPEDDSAEISQEEAAILEEVLPVTRHFYAEIEKTLSCVGINCAYTRSYIEPFTDFSVDLIAPEGGAGQLALLKGPHSANSEVSLKLDMLLTHAFREQELELSCERCQKQKKVRVTYKFRKLPRLLVVHLKRFSITGGDGYRGACSSKLQTRVMAPSTLDLAQFCDARTANPRDLSAGLGGPAGHDMETVLLKSLQESSSPPRVLDCKPDATDTYPQPVSVYEIRGRKDESSTTFQVGTKNGWTGQRKLEVPRLDSENLTGHFDVKGVPFGSENPHEDVEDEQLQEAIRLSLINERGSAARQQGDKAACQAPGEVRGGNTAGERRPSKPHIVLTDMCEDKENQPPASTKHSSPMPLNFRHIQSQPLGLFSLKNSLSAAKRVSGLDSSYTLQSVVRHLGRSANSGHYVTDVRRPGSRPASPACWTRYDDAMVSPLPPGDRILEDEVSLQTGYIFIYRAHLSAAQPDS